MLNELFARLGFTEKEFTVYLALAESGKSAATVLSKRTRIPRATLYAILESLTERGVITRENTSSTTLFRANGPESFTRMVQHQRDEVEERSRAAKQLGELLTPYMKETQYSIPKIQLYEGKPSIESMLYEYLPLWRESYGRVGNDTLWGYQDPTFVESYLRWHNHMWETRGPNERICLFSNREHLKEEVSRSIDRREVRALPAGIEFSSSIWIYGEYIVMGMTRSKPHWCVQMKDAVFSANLRAIFQLLWQATFTEPLASSPKPKRPRPPRS